MSYVGVIFINYKCFFLVLEFMVLPIHYPIHNNWSQSQWQIGNSIIIISLSLFLEVIDPELWELENERRSDINFVLREPIYLFIFNFRQNFNHLQFLPSHSLIWYFCLISQHGLLRFSSWVLQLNWFLQKFPSPFTGFIIKGMPKAIEVHKEF